MCLQNFKAQYRLDPKI